MEIRLARHSRHVAVVTVDNQPRLNAMTRPMLSDLGRLWDELERDRDCRCIVLTGAGERAFTVGADVSGDLSAAPQVARMVNHKESYPQVIPRFLSLKSKSDVIPIKNLRW
jgi:enoyl-CoA hydratase/carnithine racemase